MPTMDSYPAQTTPNDSDYHVVNDGVSGETKKITRDDYLSGAPLPNNTVTTGAITDANVTSTKLAEAFFRGRKQSIMTNSAPTGLTVQHGWGFIPGAAAGDVKLTVTFPVAFSSAPIVIFSKLADKSGSDPTAIGDLVDLSGAYGNAAVITSTNFVASVITRDAATLLSAGIRYGFSWIAIGTV